MIFRVELITHEKFTILLFFNIKMGWFSSSNKISKGKKNLIDMATNEKVYTQYMKNRIDKIKTASQLKEVIGELTAVIFQTKREKEVLEQEAQFLGVYTCVKNKINSHDSTRQSFLDIWSSFKKYVCNKKNK